MDGANYPLVECEGSRGPSEVFIGSWDFVGLAERERTGRFRRMQMNKE